MLVCKAVVERTDPGGTIFPWPHWVGAWPQDEQERAARGAQDPLHPFRRGEGMRRIALDGTLDSLEVGTVVATICAYGAREEAGADEDADPTAILRVLCERERVVVGGGIQVRVDDVVVLRPECCCGLEGWREWIAFANGGAQPWAGHSPYPYVARPAAGMIALGLTKDSAVQVEAEALRAALQSVEQDLVAFRALLRAWAHSVAPKIAERVVAKLDHDFQLTMPDA